MKDLIEKLNASDPVGKWIDDFVNSDDPKFKGKTKEERRKMAIGAYYGAQQNESVEDLEKDEDEENERKAKFKAALAATDQVAKGGMQKKGYTGSTYNPQKKLQKEEVELDEISKDLAGRYYEKAVSQHVKKVGLRPEMYSRVESDLGKKRKEGMDRAFNILTKESEEHEMMESIKVGDSVHVGHKIPGGSGYSGIVTKIDGEKIHFRSKEEGKFGHRHFVGLVKNAIKEEVEIEESMISNTFAYNLGLMHGVSQQPRLTKENLDDEAAFNSYLRGYEIGIYGSERSDTEEYLKRHQMKPVIPTTNDAGIREEFAVKTIHGKTVYSAPTEVEAKVEATRLIRHTGKRHFVQQVN